MILVLSTEVDEDPNGLIPDDLIPDVIPDEKKPLDSDKEESEEDEEWNDEDEDYDDEEDYHLWNKIK